MSTAEAKGVCVVVFTDDGRVFQGDTREMEPADIETLHAEVAERVNDQADLSLRVEGHATYINPRKVTAISVIEVTES